MMNTAFTVPSWKDPSPAPTHGATALPARDSWQIMAAALDDAKRQAALSFARFSTSPQHVDPAAHSRACDNWARDEVSVLKARVALLNELMSHDPPAQRPCIEHARSNQDPRVCVMYNRMRCEGGHELGPMQSTMAWGLKGAERAMQHLMTAGEAHQQDTLAELLALIRAFMPVRSKTDALQGLHDLLALPPPRMLLAQPDGTPGAIRIMTGVGDSSPQNSQKNGSLAPMYRLTWGAMDVSAQEGWQNPSTNAAIRLTILETARQAIHRATTDKGALWANAAFLQIHISYGDESHVLGLIPFCDSESCTVTHMQFAQSMFDHNGPERGILNLSKDPASIHPIPLGTILPLRAYVCPGAHRKGRLSEAQLNYVHAQGLLAHRFDLNLLPRPESLRYDPGGRIPAAKSTRVSATGLDILASSYHIADQVYTTISIVQYPPFGTQFATKPAPSLGPSAGDDWGDISSRSASEHSDSESDDVPMPGTRRRNRRQPKLAKKPEATPWNKAARLPLREGEDLPLYKIARESKPKARKSYTWNIELRLGEHFFIDGILGSPYGEEGLRNRLVLFEVDNSDRYKEVQESLRTIRQALLAKHAEEWNPNVSFYDNIENNDKIHKTWSELGAKFIWAMQQKFFEKGLNNDEQMCNWHTANDKVWKHILTLAMAGTESNIDDATEQVFTKLDNWYQYWVDRQMIKTPADEDAPKYLTARCDTSKQTRNGLVIPKPLQRTTSAKKKTDKDAQMEHRITSLESQLQSVKQEGNTHHLLMQVLERLNVS